MLDQLQGLASSRALNRAERCEDGESDRVRVTMGEMMIDCS